MSDAGRDPPVQPYGQTPTAPDEPPESFAARIAIAQRAAASWRRSSPCSSRSSMGGLVVLVTTGKNPIETYKAIFEGSGLNWLFPWVTGEERVLAGFNLQQTLIATTPLILVGLAVAFAFRCGLFNIGGQGQYLVGRDPRGLGRLVVRGDEPRAAHPPRDRRRDGDGRPDRRASRAS